MINKLNIFKAGVLLLFLFSFSQVEAQEKWEFSMGVSPGIEFSGISSEVKKGGLAYPRFISNLQSKGSYQLFLGVSKGSNFNFRLVYNRSKFNNWQAYDENTLYEGSNASINRINIIYSKEIYPNRLNDVLFYLNGGFGAGQIDIDFPSAIFESTLNSDVSTNQKVNTVGFCYGISSYYNLSGKTDLFLEITFQNVFYNSIYIIENQTFTAGIYIGLRLDIEKFPSNINTGIFRKKDLYQF